VAKKKFPYPELFFDSCFDQKKIDWLLPNLPPMYDVLNELASWRKGKWPTRIKCMSDKRIIQGRRRGAGHGFTFTRGRDKNTIWMNPHMTEWGHFLVFSHENLHHAFPDATEDELNCTHLPYVFKRVFNTRYDHDWARSHGVGSPVAGVGDRSYCR
jgi:hypothetical protein